MYQVYDRSGYKELMDTHSSRGDKFSAALSGLDYQVGRPAPTVWVWLLENSVTDALPPDHCVRRPKSEGRCQSMTTMVTRRLLSVWRRRRYLSPAPVDFSRRIADLNSILVPCETALWRGWAC